MQTDQDQWDKQQIRRGASFLQSRPWGSFQQSIGHNYHLVSGSGWSCLLLEKQTPLGKYLFAPYGPTIDDLESAAAAIGELKLQAKQLGTDWLRLEPILIRGGSPLLRPYLKKAGGRPSPRNVEPPLTRILDLKPSPDDMLASLSQTTRNLIRRNQREKVIHFKSSVNPDDISKFSTMLASVSSRKNVKFFSEGYFTKQARLLMPEGMMRLELAYENDTALGGLVIHDFGKLSSYTYAASLPEARKKNVSSLLLWQAIINAKSRGMERMDLFGVAPEGAPPSHPWYGFSEFKKKFGGELVEHAGTWDIPISSKYSLYRGAHKARSLLERR